MPTHWESSTRPLFVKTVVVNGNRHAILTQEDPLGQSTVSHKSSRPNSPQESYSGETNAGKNIQPLDLQGCLVKLRVVLATPHERRQPNNPMKPPMGPAHKKRKHYSKNRSASLDKKEEPLPEEPPAISPKTLPVTHQLNMHQSVAVANFFTDNDEERISGYSNEWGKRCDLETGNTAAKLGMCADYDVPWNTISADNYFTRPFYNRLSERVLQWLDLSARTSHKTEKDNTGIKLQDSKSPRLPARKVIQRQSSEDNSDEVRTDEDVETALSMEMPKFTQDLNRRHKINLPISNTTEDHSLPANSYSSFMNIRTGKCALPPKIETHRRIKRRGHLTKQVKLEDSSDEDIKCDEPFRTMWNYQVEPIIVDKPMAKRTTGREAADLLHEGGLWSGRSDERPRTGRDGKPQLHIFMPSIPQEDQTSDTET